MQVEFSAQVLQTTLAAGARFTIGCEAKCLAIQHWCAEKSLDPLAYSVSPIFSFLSVSAGEGDDSCQ